MTRILVFGDSQVATIATAFKRLDESKFGAHFEFVSAPGPIAHKLRTDGHCLHLEPVPATWAHAYLSDEQITKWHESTQAQITTIGEGRSSIDLTGFDVLVCVGGHILARWNTLHDVVATPYLSTACVQQVCLDVLDGMTHGQWLSGLMNSPHRGSIAVLSLPEPLLNEASPLVETPAYAGKNFRDVQKMIVDALPRLGSIFIPVPNELISSLGNSSPAKYKVDREGDYVHLNPNGGDLVLHSLVDALDHLGSKVGGAAVVSGTIN